jgi:hypothetical protein
MVLGEYRRVETRHKLATSPFGSIQEMTDFRGLRRTDPLWQKRPRTAVSFP